MSRFRLLPGLVVDRRLATVLLALAATLLPIALVAAATSPLGFTLGQTTLPEVRRSLPPDKITDLARSPDTTNTLIEVDPAAVDLDGLEQALLIFEHDQLVTVLLTIDKRRFRDVVANLRTKYSVHRENINNHMQYGEALFRSGDDWIYLKAPLRDPLLLLYATDDHLPDTIRGIKEDKAQKRQQEEGKL